MKRQWYYEKIEKMLHAVRKFTEKAAECRETHGKIADDFIAIADDMLAIVKEKLMKHLTMHEMFDSHATEHIEHHDSDLVEYLDAKYHKEYCELKAMVNMMKL